MEKGEWSQVRQHLLFSRGVGTEEAAYRFPYSNIATDRTPTPLILGVSYSRQVPPVDRHKLVSDGRCGGVDGDRRVGER